MITQDQVNEYFIEATTTQPLTALDQVVLERARDLALAREPDLAMFFPADDVSLYQMHSRKREATDRSSVTTNQLIYFILQELHAAICKNDSRYVQEMRVISKNGKLLVGAVAGYAAATTGVAVAILSALTASILLLVVKVGQATFCRFVSQRYRFSETRARRES